MARKHKHVKYFHPGKPTVMTPEIILKLEDAFRNAFTDEMACLYAGIGKSTLYDYCNTHPKFAERKEELKLTPNLKAQQVLVGDVNNVAGARYWAERRMPDFKPTSKIEHSGAIETEVDTVERTPEEIAALQALRIARRKRIEANSDKMP